MTSQKIMPGQIVHINAYLVTRHYGGSEEGGWWYNEGEVLGSTITSIDDPDIEEKKKWMFNIFADEEHGNIYSVLGGAKVEVLIQTSPAKNWPEVTPHYE